MSNEAADAKETKTKEPDAKSAPEFSGPTLSELNSVTEAYIKLNKLDEAIRIIDAIICQSADESMNVLNYVKKVKCLLELKRNDEALLVIERLELILKSNKNLNNLKEESVEVIGGIKEIIEKIIEKKCFDTSLVLAQCQSHVVKHFCEEGSERLKCYEETGALLERIVRETMRSCSRVDCDKPQTLMEELLREMLLIKDVEIEEKAIKLAWMYKYFAFYCDEVHNYSRSVELNQQGITVMETIFGGEASRYKVFGHLYNNMAASLICLNLKARATNAYQTAIDSYNEAEDWKNQKMKYEIINNAKKSLNKLKKK